MVELLRHRQTKEAATDMFSLKPPRHISTLPAVARAMGSARSGDLAAAERDVDNLKVIRTSLENASQSYWASQVEIQMLAASAWIAQAIDSQIWTARRVSRADRANRLNFVRQAQGLFPGPGRRHPMCT